MWTSKHTNHSNQSSPNDIHQKLKMLNFLQFNGKNIVEKVMILDA